MKVLLFFFLTGSLLSVCLGSKVCKPQDEYCRGSDCDKEQVCENGSCQPDGSCLCHSCYSGANCETFEDLEHYPYFLKEEETIYIEPTQKGLIYQAKAIDEDIDKTCQPDSTLPCPCGQIYYDIADFLEDSTTLFTLERSTGKVWLTEDAKLKDGDTFQVKIAASNYKDDATFDTSVLALDILKLNIYVRESNSVQEFLTNANRKLETREQFTDDILLGSEDITSGYEEQISVRRAKREAFSSDPSNINLTLSILNSPISEPIKPGQNIDFELKIILPQITTPLDFDVELYVMDTVSGITTMALCNVNIVDVGGGANLIKKDGNALTVADVKIENIINDHFKFFYDRSILNFGFITNDDTVTGGTNYGPSTILVHFTAIMIPNALYTNTSAIVTAGAEYDGEKFVWVSQAIFTFDQTLDTYPSAVTIEGPSSIGEDSAAQFDIKAYISDPFENVTVEIFSPSEIYDQFSVSSLIIASKGEDHSCTTAQEVYTFQKSVSGKSNHRALIEFKTLVKDLDYANALVGEDLDIGNLVVISFTIFVVDAKATDIISVGAGITIGTTKLWTGFANLTIDAGAPALPGSAPLTDSFRALDTSTSKPTVAPGGTATYEVRVNLNVAGTYTAITCTATATSPNKICGVGYGKSGKYAATFPSLLDSSIITYNDAAGTATWTLSVLSAQVAGTPDPAQNYVSFEVTVLFVNPSATATVTCAGPSYVMDAIAGMPGIEDLSGVTTQLGDTSDWYAGSQAGMLATLTFPPDGVPYGSILLETAGDFLQTSYGSRICDFDIIRVGRAVTCVSRNASQLDEMVTYKKALDTSFMDDSAEIYLGEICGSVLDDASPDDNSFILRIVYEVPLGQAGLTASTFNLSVGAMLDDNLIWTGWSDYNFLLAPASITLDPAQLPYFTVTPPEILSAEQYRPFIIKLQLKTHPGSIGKYLITATSSNTAIIEICRIVIVHIGFNYACLDQSPYGKHLDPAQSIKIIHDATDWGLSAQLNLGIIRNLGQGDVFPSTIADEDTILIAVIARGVATGSADVTINYVDGRVTPLADVLVSMGFTLHGPTSLDSVTIDIQGYDGTMEYYKDVTKQLNVSIIIPPNYDKMAYLEVINYNVDTTTLCFAEVALVEANVPCVIPPKILSNRTVGTTGEDIIKLDFKVICHVQITDNITGDNVINVRVGLMPRNGISSADITIKFYEGDPGVESLSKSATITLSAGVYDPGNYSMNGIMVYAVNNATVTYVQPGYRIWEGIYIKIPPSLTLPIQMGIMASSTEGHAQATIHGFRWGEKQGKNIACAETLEMYQYQLLQNASVDGVPMYHESQTDSLVTSLKYLTNTGISYLQFSPKPDDDLAMIEADVLIADHEGLVTGDIITLSFSLKIGMVIVVLEKNFTIQKPADENVMVLETEFNFTDSNFDPTVPLKAGEKLALTGRIRHIINESHIEAYDALLRIYTPNFVVYVNESLGLPLVAGATGDTSNINITSTTSTVPMIAFDIDYLFFTDIVEFNVTMTVDPYGDMPKGLGIVEATAIMRLVCRESMMSNPAIYCGNATYVNYLVDGSECYDDLQVSTFQPCQFLASSAIDNSVNAEKAATAAGWYPAVRDSTVWKHYISVDFLRKVRITKITFTYPTSRRVNEFKLQISGDGLIFIDACPYINLTSGELPTACKTEARYARIVIMSLTNNDETTALGVSFQWFGCPLESTIEMCTFPVGGTPLTTNASIWRHFSLDSTLNIVYFCDYNPRKMRMACYSSSDGQTWNVLPAYIGSLAGYDATTQKMYAYDIKRMALMGSLDGVQWGLVDSAAQASLDMAALSATVHVIPGKDMIGLSAIIDGPWTADFVGMKMANVYKVKWGKCCN